MTDKLIQGIFRRVNRGRVRDLLTGKIHESFTVAADQLFQRGYMTEKERIDLSGVIGDVLPQFQEGIDDAVGNRPVDTDDLRAIAEMSLVKRTHSRSKCMQCDEKPTIAAHWADGRGMAWFCKKHFKGWLEEDERDICGVWVLEEGECPEDIRKTPKGTNKVRKLGEDVSQREIYSRIDELTKRGGPGSGHHGHRGVRGQTGGSLPRSKGTHLGGLGVPDMKDASKRAFVSQRILQVDDDTVVALVSLRRMDVFKTKPYRMESRWYVKDRKGPATEAQQRVGAELLDNLEVSTAQIMEISGWERSTYRDNLWTAPWGNALRLPVGLITKPYSNVPEEKWDDMDSCVEKVMADGKTKEQAIAICYSSIVERQDIKEEVEDPIAEEKESPIPAGEVVEETPTEAGAWTPPNISIQELMDMEPAAMFYNGSVKDVVQSERELRAFRRKVNRMQDIADLRPQEWKKETPIERVIGVFRRIFRHYGPGPHPGTGTEQTIHAGGAAGAADVGVEARPAHVGPSIKLQRMANPRTTGHVNDTDHSQWQQIRDEYPKWGTDKENGELIEDGAWPIAQQVLDNVEYDLRGRETEEWGERTTPDENIVQQYVDDMINSDIENDHDQIEQALGKLADEVRGEILGSTPTWADISKLIGKSEDEMVGMSESDIDEAIEINVSLGVLDQLEKLEKGEDVDHLESWMTSFILGADSTAELRENLEDGDYSGDVADHLQAEAYDALEDHHGQNPTGYDYDYFIDELGLEPESFGVGREELGETYYEGEGEFTNQERSYFYSTDNETGEIVAVMQTTRSYEDISRSRIEEAAERFGFDADEVSGEMLVIDLLASKYPRQGYGTEMILSALEQAHNEDRGLSGSAVMAAAMFYDKLGAQYLSELGQTQGGSAFWTNVQVHAAYEWLNSQMEEIRSGEITEAEIGAEQTAAETREPSAPSPSPTSPAAPTSEQFQTSPGGVSLVNFGGGEQSRNMGIQNQAAANSRYLSFDHESGAGVPVIAIEVGQGGRTGPRVWEVVGSGQIYDNEDDLLEDTVNWGFVPTGAGPVGSNTMGMILEQITGNEDMSQRFLYNMLTQSNRGEYLRAYERQRASGEEPENIQQIQQSIEDAQASREEELAEASLRHDSLRRVERHYGPGDHPGTGTSQDVHGKGGGGKTRVGITSARPGKPSGQVFEEMGIFKGELNKITSIKNVSVTPGLGGWEGERESAWIVSYEGNGNAMRLIARTAKEKEQEAVIFAREGGDEPISTFAFSDRVTPDERGKVEDLLVEAGVGWSWLRLPGGQPTLMIMNVPQYGGVAEEHRTAMSKLANMFDVIEMPHEFNEVVRKVDILEKEGPYGYDTILEAGN